MGRSRPSGCREPGAGRGGVQLGGHRTPGRTRVPRRLTPPPPPTRPALRTHRAVALRPGLMQRGHCQHRAPKDLRCRIDDRLREPDTTPIGIGRRLLLVAQFRGTLVLIASQEPHVNLVEHPRPFHRTPTTAAAPARRPDTPPTPTRRGGVCSHHSGQANAREGPAASPLDLCTASPLTSSPGRPASMPAPESGSTTATAPCGHRRLPSGSAEALGLHHRHLRQRRR